MKSRPPQILSSSDSLESFVRMVSQRTQPIDKTALILQACDGRSVLDIGCIDHSATKADELGDRWLHGRIKQVAQSVVGLDMLADDAAELNKLGYDIRIGNAEDFDLGERFDMVIAGDIVEHVSNLGLFLTGIANHMHPDSHAILTTPNPFNFEQFVQILFHNRICVNSEHTVWLDPNVIFQLIERSPLRIEEFHWIDTRFKFTSRLPGARSLGSLIMKMRPLARRDFALVLTLRDQTATA